MQKNRTIAMYLLCSIILCSIVSCNKNTSTDNGEDFNSLKQTVLTQFVNKVVVPDYYRLDSAATTLNNAIIQLNIASTETNLTAAKDAWKNLREIWELSEGYLLGPVEDNDYDPAMDTWPTDYVQMDSVIKSTNALSISDIQGFTLSLRGFHPIEYILFGNHGSRKATDLTIRQKNYLVSLIADVKSTCHELYNSWTLAPTPFSQEIMNAGTTTSKYAKKQDVYIAIVSAMAGICEEVADGKLKEPYDTRDPNIVESPYSGNSLTDFKNNIIGVQRLYMGVDGGKGIHELVAYNNKSMDVDIQNKLNAAILSFNNITVPFEQAIISERLQVLQNMNAISNLQEVLENNLQPFIQQYITD